MQNRPFFGLILLAVMVGLGFQVVRPFLAPLAWAAILAYLTTPIYRRILRLAKGRSSLAAGVATTLMIALLLVPVSFLLVRLPRELAESYRELSTAFDEPIVLPEALTRIPVLGPVLDETLTNFWNDPEIRKQQVKDWLEPWSRELGSVVGRLGRSVAQLAVAIVMLFFLYRDGDAALQQLRQALQKVVGEMADKYFQAIGDTTRAVVFGLIVSSLAQGFIAGVGYQIFGVGTPILLGSLTAVTALVPFLGTVVVWGPIGIGLLVAGHLSTGLALLAWGTFIVNPIDNILKPLLISGATDVPLAVVLIGVMGGLLAFGLLGLFLGPLILSVLLAIWREWLAEDHPGRGVAGA
jgi:predicted PurR-regulated permease PerM